MELIGRPLGLLGPTGYNNGVYLLNDICKSRYGNASLGATARNMTIEDIESRMNAAGIAARNAYKTQTTQYGTTKTFTGSNIKYPAIYVQEKYSGVNISDVTDGTQIILGEVDETALGKMNPKGKKESEDVYMAATTDTYKTDATNLTCTQTYYYMSSPSSYFDKNFYSMVFRADSTFWLASRFVVIDSNLSRAGFGLRTISSSGVHHLEYGNDLAGTSLAYSDGGSSQYAGRVTPVVSFNSGIQVKSGKGTESNPYEIGK